MKTWSEQVQVSGGRFGLVVCLSVLLAVGCGGGDQDPDEEENGKPAGEDSGALALKLSLDEGSSDLPSSMEGTYRKAFHCDAQEGGARFEGVDHSICYRKEDGSNWRAWNTGCGWEFGRVENDEFEEEESWQRYARTYSGQCADMPMKQYSFRALETDSFFDGAGNPIGGVSSQLKAGALFELIAGEGSEVPAGMAGIYNRALGCERESGGAWFGGIDYKICYRHVDDPEWKAWNTGCGWEFGRMEADEFEEDKETWKRYARTYSGQCSEMPDDQLASRALMADPLFDGFGDPLPELSSVAKTEPDPGDLEHQVVSLDDDAEVPARASGKYRKAFDCEDKEGGARFGGVDHAICFRKADGSRWRSWNTGCGWEIGRIEHQDGVESWKRYARTYSGQCSEMPMEQYGTRALKTAVFYDGLGALLDGVASQLEGDPGLEVTVGEGAEVPTDMAGDYSKAFDCSRDQGGAWFGEVDYQVCYRKNGPSDWKAWNTGCGWEFGRMEEAEHDPDDEVWQRYARTYSGKCSEMPSEQKATRALTTETFFDGAGNALGQIKSVRVQ